MYLTYLGMRRDLQRAPGLIRHAFFLQSPLVCCTLSIWDSEASLTLFSNVRSHVRAVRRAKRWCREIWSAYWRLDAVSKLATEWSAPGQGQWPVMDVHPRYHWRLVPAAQVEGREDD